MKIKNMIKGCSSGSLPGEQFSFKTLQKGSLSNSQWQIIPEFRTQNAKCTVTLKLALRCWNHRRLETQNSCILKTYFLLNTFLLEWPPCSLQGTVQVTILPY